MPQKNIKDANIGNIVNNQVLTIEAEGYDLAILRFFNLARDRQFNFQFGGLINNWFAIDRYVSGAYVGTPFIIDQSQNIMLNATTAIDGTGNLVLGNGTAPSTPIAGVHIWSQGDEGKIMDGSGNTTTFSPHNFEGITLDPDDPFPTTIYHENPYIGVRQWIYTSKMARIIQDLTGEQLIWEEEIPKRNWANDETAKQQRRNADIAEYDAAVAAADALPDDKREIVLKVLGERPKPYTKRNEPTWITQRKNRQR